MASHLSIPSWWPFEFVAACSLGGIYCKSVVLAAKTMLSFMSCCLFYTTPDQTLMLGTVKNARKDLLKSLDPWHKIALRKKGNIVKLFIDC